MATAPAGEQPAGVGVGCGGEVEPVVDVLVEQLCEGFREWCWRVAEPDADLGAVMENIVDADRKSVV